VGRSFANLHIKSNNLEKTVEALRDLCEGHASVLGKSYHEALESKVVMYVSKSNENWISVLHDYFIWGTVKESGKTLSRLIGEPVMTAGYMNEEIIEFSLDIRNEDFDDLISITSPEQAVDKLSELIGMSLWCDSEWIPHEESLRKRFGKYGF